MSEQPTFEEVMKVRRHECAVRGHTYTEVETLGSDGPTAVVCSNCGRTWRVMVDGEVERLRGLLKQLEFAGYDIINECPHACPACERLRPFHEPDCWLAAEIDR